MPHRLGWLRYAALLLLALALLRPGERALPPIDRDEARYAQATMQMIETGDYLDVRFLDQPRYLQPAGIYWLQSAAVRLFGDPPARRIWVHRLVSQASAAIAVLLTGWIGARLFGRDAGFAAAILLASTALLGFEGRIATIDATQLAAILAAQAALASIWLARDNAASPPRRLPAAAFWIAVGAGTMLKGPVTALVAFSTLAALAISERRTDWLRRLFWAWGVPLALLIILPWFVAIGVVSRGDFFARSVGQNLLGKVASGQQAHGAPPGAYLALFSFTFGPASLLAALAAPGVWARRREPAVRFCLCWILPTWLVFEAVLTKLPHYVLPTYPAIAMLTAAALARRGSAARPAWRSASAIYAAAWLLVWLAAAWAPAAALWQLEDVLSPLAVAAAIVVSAALGLLLLAVRRGRPGVAIACAAAASLVWSADLYGDAWPRLATLWIAPRVAELEARTRPCSDSSVASASFSEPSLPYLLGTRTVVTGVDGAALHVIADPACALALVGSKEDAAFRVRLAAAGLAPVALGAVAGVDWVTGRKLDLTLFSAAPPRPAALEQPAPASARRP